MSSNPEAFNSATTATSISETTVEDHLDVDKPIIGQNYVCLSFISPEKVLERKEMFFLKKFLQQLQQSREFNINDVKEKFVEWSSVENQSKLCQYVVDKFQVFENPVELFETFMDRNQQSLENEFYAENNFQTSVRGVKIRGTYDTKKEAEIRAQVLQRMDRSFHVYVGQVGYWLPWDPNPNDIADSVYLEKELNDLAKNYKENEVKRDIFYEEQKQQRKREAMEEKERQKQLLHQQQIQAMEADIEKGLNLGGSGSVGDIGNGMSAIDIKEVYAEIENEMDHLSRKNDLKDFLQENQSSVSSAVVEPEPEKEEINYVMG